MNHCKLRLSTLIATLTGVVHTANAQQPPDNVVSDGYGDTAAGTGALLNDQPVNGGIHNSAFGNNSLNSNTTGALNTAVGFDALFANTLGHTNTAIGHTALRNNSSGHNNLAVGAGSLYSNTTGFGNAAVGTGALYWNTTGTRNAALGTWSLYRNTTGNFNTASGHYSLAFNTTGNDNTAIGHYALQNNVTGIQNTATGSGALLANTASNNSAFGYQALYSNTSGGTNAAVGASAMFSNSTGANNTAFGYLALYANTTGKGNAAQGVNALYNNTTGIRNLGIGSNALYDNSTGSYNIALGFDAGYYVTTGSNNIEIGALGTASDNGTIQIGVQGTQTSASIAGIYGTPLTGSAVYVTSTGQLGVLGSSERFKTDITPMPDLSSKLSRLRPVTFRYKTDPKSIRQYGLIAEEVDKVYPELVIRDAKGAVQGVRYEELAPMLLNELQQQAAEFRDLQREQRQKAAAYDAEIGQLKAQLAEVRAALATLQPEDKLVAQR